MTHKVIVFGGGTFNHVSCHLALCAPAFGETAKRLHKLFQENGTLDSHLVLTKMADSTSQLITNADLENFIVDKIIPDNNVKAIIMNAAICDFYVDNLITEETRLSSQKEYPVVLRGIQGKMMTLIKQSRPDIVVVGFKTTHGASRVEQVAKAFNSMHVSGLDLVLANDLDTRNNIIISNDLGILEGRREWLLEQLVDNTVIKYNLKMLGLEE